MVPEGKNESPQRDFEDRVFKAELEALTTRSSAATRGQPNVPGLPAFGELVDADDRSAFLENTLAMLSSEEQNELWEMYADSDARKAGLTGVAFSGGGIRSASVNLGIVQVLHRIGLFQCFDYMSTVSGGGYLGASITTGLSRKKERDEIDPGRTAEANLEALNERFPYKHEPGKPENAAFRQIRNYSSFLAPHGKLEHLKLPVLLLRGILINFLIILPWILGLALATHWLMGGSGEWFWTKHPTLPASLAPAASFLLTGVFGLVFLALVVLFPIGRTIHRILNPNTDPHKFRGRYESFMAVVLLLTLGFTWIELQPFLLDAIEDRTALVGKVSSALAGTSALLATFTHVLARNLSKILSRFGLYLVALLALAAFWLLYLLLVLWLMEEPGLMRACAAALIALFFYTNLFVDANGLSLHNFYKDRLSDAFIFDHDQETDSVDTSSDPRLTELANCGVGPFHLINTTLNTREFPENFRKGRRGEPFLLSPRHFGSRITGYSPTEELEKEQPEVRLSTAIATSGAAVSSNMGTQTTHVLRLILSVLNIRLGYWLINPLATRSKGAEKFWFAVGKRIRAGVFRFLQELTGFISYRTSYVYLSDGGHIDNLGLYELVRRQCRFIVIGDGECDPNYHFKGLADALRLIRTDFGVVVEMEGLDEIRSGEQQYARGTIYYPDERVGYLIYLKSSSLGDDMIEATVSPGAYESSPLRSDVRRFDELTYMAHYKAENPDFPQETTADQFFDEVQFEAYRALGYVIAERALTKDHN